MVNLLNEAYVDIYLDESRNILIAKWMGLLKPVDVRSACSFIANYLKENRVQGLLTDHRQLKVLSQEVQDYLIQEAFPEVEKAGLKKVGVIAAHDVYAAATVSKVNHEVVMNDLKINLFNAQEDCVNWILS